MISSKNKRPFLLFSPPPNVSRKKFYFLLVKRFFDTGYAHTNYLKYLIALFGLSSLNVEKTIILAVVYAMACLVIGYLWHRYDFAEIDVGIGNMFNPFVQEMREYTQNGKPMS